MYKKIENSPNGIFGLSGKIFQTVATAGSFKKAAESLNLSISTVSYHIELIESQLGISLFDRSKKPAELSREAHSLLNELNFIYNHFNERARFLKEMTGQHQVLKLGIVESLSTTLAEAISTEFCRNLAGVEIITSSSRDLLMLLEKKKIDFLITFSPAIDTQSLIKTKLFIEPSVLALPPSISKLHKCWTWHNLKFCGKPFIASSKNSANNQITTEFFNSLFLQLPTKYIVNESAMRLSFIGNDLGWSFIRPTILLKHPSLASKISLFPMPEPVLERTVSLVSRAGESEKMHKELATFCTNYFETKLKILLIKLCPWLNEYYKFRK